MNRAIKKKTANRAISEILSRHDEGMRWSLYLACVANPFCDASAQSFEEFTQCVKNPDDYRTEENSVDVGMSKAQILRQLYGADRILSNFVPKMEGGGNA